jgi:hypothetical protein
LWDTIPTYNHQIARSVRELTEKNITVGIMFSSGNIFTNTAWTERFFSIIFE